MSNAFVKIVVELDYAYMELIDVNAKIVVVRHFVNIQYVKHVVKLVVDLVYVDKNFVKKFQNQKNTVATALPASSAFFQKNPFQEITRQRKVRSSAS